MTTINETNACRFDLARLMRANKVTIRELSKRMNVTMKDIRRIRSMARVSYCTFCDYTQAVTGVNVFNLARYYAIKASTEH